MSILYIILLQSLLFIEKDTISGFKQGDNGLYQIKANKADKAIYVICYFTTKKGLFTTWWLAI